MLGISKSFLRGAAHVTSQRKRSAAVTKTANAAAAAAVSPVGVRASTGKAVPVVSRKVSAAATPAPRKQHGKAPPPAVMGSPSSKSAAAAVPAATDSAHTSVLSPPTQKLLTKAFTLHYVRGRPGAAIPVYAKAVKSMREEAATPALPLPEVLYNYALAYIEEDEVEEALPLLQESVKRIVGTPLQARSYRIQLTLARVLNECMEDETAALTFERLAKVAETNPKLLQNQIGAEFKRSNLDLAEIYWSYANYLAWCGNPENAETYFEKCLAADPGPIDRISMLESYGTYLSQLGDTDRAHELSDEMFSLAEKCKLHDLITLSAWKQRINYFDRQGHEHEVTALYDKLLSVSSLPVSDRADVFHSYVDFLEKHRRHAKLDELYAVALETEPGNVHMMVQIAWNAHRMGKSDADVALAFSRATEALADCADAEENPWDACYVHGEFAVYLQDKAKRLPEAAAQYTKALEADGAKESRNYVQVAANYASLLAVMGKDAESEKWFANATTNATADHSRAWTLYLDHLIHSGKVERGMEIAALMLEKFPDERSAIRMRKAKLHELEDPVDTVKLSASYMSAIQLACPNPDASMTLEELCEASSNTQAIAEYAAVLSTHFRRHDDAVTCYKALRRRLPHDANIAIHYGRLLNDVLDDRAGASAEFESVLRMDPTNVYALDFVAQRRWIEAEDIDGAEDCHLQALRGTQASSSSSAHRLALHHYAAFLLYVAQNRTLLEHVYSKLVAKYPDDCEAHIGYAVFLRSTLQSTSAPDAASLAKIEQLFAKALALDEKHVEGNLQYASYLTTVKHDYVTAAAHFQVALQKEPRNEELLRMIVCFLVQRSTADGDNRYLAEAEKTFAKLLALNRRDVKSLSLYAWFLRDVRKDTAAASKVQDIIRELQKDS